VFIRVYLWRLNWRPLHPCELSFFGGGFGAGGFDDFGGFDGVGAGVEADVGGEGFGGGGDGEAAEVDAGVGDGAHHAGADAAGVGAFDAEGGEVVAGLGADGAGGGLDLFALDGGEEDDAGLELVGLAAGDDALDVAGVWDR
jgi:hypothetical protein